VKILDRLLALPPAGSLDPAQARSAPLLRLLLQCMLVFLVLVLLIVTPLFAVRKAATVALCLAGFLVTYVSAARMRKGQIQRAAWIQLGGIWAGGLICILLSGGIHSPYMALLVAMTVVAGLLLGRKAASSCCAPRRCWCLAWRWPITWATLSRPTFRCPRRRSSR
jgi:hypothetical protein